MVRFSHSSSLKGFLRLSARFKRIDFCSWNENPMATNIFNRRTPTEDDWSEFEKQLGITEIKQQSDSSSSKAAKFEKLYVVLVFHCDEFVFEHRVYSIDLTRDSTTDTIHSIEPIVRWDLAYDGAVAILGSTLYLFGGSNKCIWGKSMRFFDLETALSSTEAINFDLDLGLLQTGEEMLGSKCDPIAVVIGDSKICVFGRVLYCSRLVDVDLPLFSGPCFEVYDTKKHIWKQLPEPIDYKDHYDTISMYSYCVHHSFLIIQTVEQGIYGINVESPAPTWVKLGGSQEIFPGQFRMGGLWTMVGKHLCSPFHFMIQGDLKFELHPFRLKSPPCREYLLGSSPEGVLCVGGDNLFIVRAGFAGYIPNLLVDIVKFDGAAIEEFGSDLPKWQEIQCDKSFTFSLNPGNGLSLLACFPIKEIGTSEDDIYHKLKRGRIGTWGSSQ